MSNASKSFTSMQATRSHRRDVNGMVGQWSTFNQMRTFLREICVPLQPADPLKSTASAALQKGLMFQPHSESLVVETSNHAVWWTSCLANRSHKGTQKSLGNHRTFTRKMPESSELGGMAQSVEHFVHIEGVVGSSPTVTTEKSGRRSRSTLAGFFCVPFCVPLRVRTRGTQRVRKNRCVPVRKWGTQMPKKRVPLRVSRSHQPWNVGLDNYRVIIAFIPGPSAQE